MGDNILKNKTYLGSKFNESHWSEKHVDYSAAYLVCAHVHMICTPVHMDCTFWSATCFNELAMIMMQGPFRLNCISADANYIGGFLLLFGLMIDVHKWANCICTCALRQKSSSSKRSGTPSLDMTQVAWAIIYYIMYHLEAQCIMKLIDPSSMSII